MSIYFIIISCILFQNVSSLSIEETPNDEYYVRFKCVSKILMKQSLKSIFIVSNTTQDISLNYNDQNALIITDIKHSLEVITEKYEMYVLIFETLDKLVEWLQNVKQIFKWNPHGYFIISIIDENVDDIFNIAWKFYLINIYVITQNKVYSYYPLLSKECRDFSAKYQFSCEEDIPDVLFPEAVPLKLQNCTIRLMSIRVPPFVISNSERSRAITAGLEVIIIHTLCERLNLRQEYIKHNITRWGFKLLSGKYTDVFEELKNNRTDMVFGIVPAVSEEFEYLELAVTDNLVWFVPTPKKRPLWTNLLSIFHNNVWMAIFICVVINAISWWMVEWINKEFKMFFSVIKCMYLSWYILLQGGMPATPKSVTLRLLVILWFIFALIVNCSYQSQLISFLTTPRYEHQISNQQELVDSGLQFGFLRPASQYFQNKRDPIHKIIAKNFVECPITAECVNRTAFQRDFAVFKCERLVTFLMDSYYTDSDGYPLLYKFDSAKVMVFVRYNTNKGYPLKKRFDPLIRELHANGLINKWDQDLLVGNKKTVKNDAKSLQLEHFVFPFICLFIGYFVGVLVLMIEILYFRCKVERPIYNGYFR